MITIMYIAIACIAAPFIAVRFVRAIANQTGYSPTEVDWAFGTILALLFAAIWPLLIPFLIAQWFAKRMFDRATS